MPDTNAVTSQPVSAANNFLPSAPPEDVVVTQPLNNEKHIPLKEPAENGADMHVNTYSFMPMPPSAPNMTEQPVNTDEKIIPELTRADAVKSEEKRKRQRRNDCCCSECADSCEDDDIFCWYIIWRCYCQCLGHFCDGCASCLGSFCGCGDHDGCDGCCEESAGDAVTGGDGDGGCCGDGDGGDAD